MYCEPDTTFVSVGNTKVLISVYSPSKKVDSKVIAENIKTTLEAQRNYLGGNLPVDKYAFIIYLYAGISLSGAAGALEHSNSSFYYLPEMEPKQLAKTVTDVAAHEFFHIVTPLTVHSEEIGNFDFNKPKMSKHLWLYEGVTEYFAGHMQAYEKLISPDDYLIEIQAKIKGAENYNENISFTELSLGALDKHKNQYGNVYQKGALIGLCIDIMLRDLSNGAIGLKDMMAKLSEKFGKERAFKDEELFDIIEKITYPEIKEFLNKHVEKNSPLPINAIFNKVGIDYIAETTIKEPSLGGAAYGFNYETNRLVIMDVSNIDAMGQKLKLKNGDEIISINGRTFLPENIEQEITNYKKKTKEGQKVAFLVARKKGNKTINTKLTAKAILIEQKVKHILSFNDRVSDKQLNTRKTWLNFK
jgi:predicted metalloprotease with PDZ domain